MGGSVFHSCMEFFFWLDSLFFPFLLVDRRERAVSSLVYHYDEWPCCGLVTSPAELNQQTTWNPERAGHGSWRESCSLSLFLSVVLCYGSTLQVVPYHFYSSSSSSSFFFPSCLSSISFLLHLPAHIPGRIDTWCQAGRARAKGPVPFSHLFLSLFPPYTLWISQHLRHNRTLWIWYWLDYICLRYRCRCCYCCFVVVLFFILFFPSLKHLTNQITNCPETDTMGTNSIGMHTLKQSHKTQSRLFLSSFLFIFIICRLLFFFCWNSLRIFLSFFPFFFIDRFKIYRRG